MCTSAKVPGSQPSGVNALHKLSPSLQGYCTQHLRSETYCQTIQLLLLPPPFPGLHTLVNRTQPIFVSKVDRCTLTADVIAFQLTDFLPI